MFIIQIVIDSIINDWWVHKWNTQVFVNKRHSLIISSGGSVKSGVCPYFRIIDLVTTMGLIVLGLFGD